MKLKTFTIIFAAMLAAMQTVFAEEKVGDITKVGNSAYMLVREFNTPEQNSTFQRNLEIMRRHAQIINAVKAKVGEEKDENKKKELETKLKQLEDEFEVNDKAMQKAYAFASSRQYRLVFLESNICTPLTKQELSSLRSEDGKELDPMLISERDNTSYYRHMTISGVKENEELQRVLGFSLTRKIEIDQLRQKLSKTTDADEQMTISQQLANSEKALKENTEKIRGKYGIKGEKDYVVETSKSKLYLILTPEELAKIEAQNAVSKSSATQPAEKAK